MTQATLEAELKTTAVAVIPAPPDPARSPRRAGPMLAMGAGLLVLAVAATVLVSSLDGRERVVPTPGTAGPIAEASATDPLAITLTARDVSVVSQVYEPGDDSGWHSHSGIHAVSVVSGTLTVLDGACRATTYGPGQPYVGGQDVHLVRNDGPVPVVMAVTYLSPSTGAQPTKQHTAPAGC